VERLLKRGEISGRSDDQDESKIRNRFQEYNTKTAILKDYFSKQNKYYGIHGVGSIASISEKINAVFVSL
jgi:adenylate kinase